MPPLKSEKDATQGAAQIATERGKIMKWYAVQKNRNDPLDYGSEDYCIAVDMLREQGRGLIAVIENHTCVEEIEYEDLPVGEHMSREQVIRELTALMEGFLDEYGAHPVCIEEAIRLLKEETK